MAKTEMLSTLRKLVRESLELQATGANPTITARAQGFVDGYMTLMLDGALATQKELLALVIAERQRVSGPATKSVPADAFA